MSKRVTLIGLGLMGSAIAQRLSATGHQLTVWNRTAAAAAPFAGSTVRIAPSLGAAVADADLVFCCQTHVGITTDLLCSGPDAALSNARAGTVVVDLSTSSPADARAFAHAVGQFGCSSLDSPVSGGPGAARTGSLTLFLGGDDTAVHLAMPTLRDIGGHITHMGPAGSGQAAKLCNQLIVAVGVMAIAEAVALARLLGVDASRLPAALAGGFADSRPLQLFGPLMAVPASSTPPSGKIETMLKDVDAIQAVADGALPIFSSAASRYRTAVAAGLGNADLSQIIHLYQQDVAG